MAYLDTLANLIRPVFQNRKTRLNQKACNDMSKILGGATIHLLDVGASGGLEPRWQPYKGLISYTGFEPDERSWKNLLNSPASSSFASYDVIPKAVWSKTGPLTYNLTQAPRCSSHFYFNDSFINRFGNPQDSYTIRETDYIDATTIDDVIGTGKNDFMKLDIQGGELEALKGAQNTLKSCLGLEIEVEFVQIYKDQPLFGSVCAFLSYHEFDFQDFVGLSRIERSNLRDLRNLGECVSGDALFLRSPEAVCSMVMKGNHNTNKLKCYMSLLLMYSRIDLLVKTRAIIAQNQLLKPEYLFEIDKIINNRQLMINRQAKIIRLGNAVLRILNTDNRIHLLY